MLRLPIISAGALIACAGELLQLPIRVSLSAAIAAQLLLTVYLLSKT
jgi:hypothetical protein